MHSLTFYSCKNYSIASGYLMLILGLFLSSCEESERNRASISLSESYKGSGVYSVSHHPFFDDVLLQNGNFDSSRVIDFELLSPLMVRLSLDSNDHRIYLEPGFSLTMDVDPTSGALIYSGEGSVINNAFLNISKMTDSFQMSDPMQFEMDVFLSKFDSLSQAMGKIQEAAIAELGSEGQKMLLRKFVEFSLASLKLEYGFHLHNSALIEQIYASQKNEEIKQFEFPKQFKGIVLSVPLDTVLFNTEMVGYDNLLYNYLLEGVHNSSFDIKRWNSPDPLTSHRLLMSTTLPRSIKEYLIANNFRHWVNALGITPEVDTIYFEFNQLYPVSPAKDYLKKLYQDNLAILPGSVAPEIAGVKLDGSIFTTESIKDKAIYVDVWATWCAPCVQEIPFSISLQTSLSANKNVIFLNASVDKDVDAWKRMLAKENDWKGIHIVLDEEQVESLQRNYKVNGYPKYFIIHKGKIVTAKAARPSQANLKKVLEDLVKKG